MSKRYGLVAVAVVLAAFVFENYYLRPGAEALRDRLSSEYTMMQKEEQYLKSSAAAGEDIKAVSREVGTLEKGLLPEKSEFLAAARLQGEVSDLAAKAGLSVMTIRPMEVSQAGSYRSIPIYFEGSGGIRQMGDFLRSVESDALLIRIDKLGLSITNMQNPKDLKFKIQVSGLAKL
ncbi:MAG: type 4a pilus biogenesis protein PilO [Nitrospiraceae bacterium]|nr:type 4a pilus biogenesis protein PilO [Nitrospiraceae bacterium]